MKRWDGILIALFLLPAALWLLLQRPQPERLLVNIYVDGELVSSAPLPAQATALRIEWVGGYNLLLLEPDGVRMQAADCPAGDCVHSGKITRAPMAIACLPHHVLVVLEGAAETGEGGVDIVAG